MGAAPKRRRFRKRSRLRSTRAAARFRTRAGWRTSDRGLMPSYSGRGPLPPRVGKRAGKRAATPTPRAGATAASRGARRLERQRAGCRSWSGACPLPGHARASACRAGDACRGGRGSPDSSSCGTSSPAAHSNVNDDELLRSRCRGVGIDESSSNGAAPGSFHGPSSSPYASRRPSWRLGRRHVSRARRSVAILQ